MDMHPAIQKCFFLALLVIFSTTLATCSISQGIVEREPTLTPVPSPTPSTFYQPLPLGFPPANGSIDFADPPVGNVLLDNVPFLLSHAIVKTQASTPPYDDYPISILLEETVSRAHRVHLLLNTGNGFTEFDGQLRAHLRVRGVQSIHLAQPQIAQIFTDFCPCFCVICEIRG